MAPLRLEMKVGLYNRWLPAIAGGERHALALAEVLSQKHSVEVLTHRQVDRADLEDKLRLNLSRITVRLIPDLPEPELSRFTADYDLFVNASDRPFIRCRAPKGLLLTYFPIPVVLSPWARCKRWIGLWLNQYSHYPLYRLLFEKWFSGWGQRLRSIPATLSLADLDTYDLICANSQFTRSWVERYWQRDSEVFYPPVEVEAFRPLPKCNHILNVGRFVAGVTDKKHTVMIQTFRQLVEQGLTGWELHMAGGTRLEPVHQAYLKRIQAAATGYPIHFHLDVPFDELVQLYGHSAIYWHASGYGADERREPFRFEHFGLSTVEAMAAGCVPVVIGRGGQTEIVQHDRDGFLWLTLDELRRYTLQLIHDGELRQSLSRRAMARSRAFDRTAFAEAVARLLARIGL